MEKGQRVKIKSSGLTGIIADGNGKLLNITIDEKHLSPGDDATAYLKPDEVEILEEAATEEKETATEQGEAEKADTATITDKERIISLEDAFIKLDGENFSLRRENEELKAEVTKLTQKLSEKQ